MIDDIEFLDDATRPAPPKLEGLRAEHKHAGAHLREVHDHLRDNMKTLRVLIERAAKGEVKAGEVEETTGQLEMIANFRRFGNLCGQYCQFVHGHHSLEDQMLFPAIAAQGEVFRKIAERLQAEHAVVHELLMRLVDALNQLASEPSRETFETTKTIYEALERVLLSHLGYEEDAIGDAMGYFGLF
jgi:hemerythrin-like domain-containing protein